MMPLLGPDYRPLIEIENGLAAGILIMLGVGLVVGTLARIMAPARGGTTVATLTIGVVGALAVGLLGRGLGWYGSGESVSVVAAAVGAAALLLIYRAVSARTTVTA